MLWCWVQKFILYPMYILLIHWPLYHCIMIFSYNSFWFKVDLICFSWFLFAWAIFYCIPSLESMCALKVWLFSCRQHIAGSSFSIHSGMLWFSLEDLVHLPFSWASQVFQWVKNPPEMQELWVWSLGGEDPVEEGMAWQFTLVFLPGDSHGQRSLMGSVTSVMSRGLQRIGHDWSDWAHMHTSTPFNSYW